MGTVMTIHESIKWVGEEREEKKGWGRGDNQLECIRCPALWSLPIILAPITLALIGTFVGFLMQRIFSS